MKLNHLCLGAGLLVLAGCAAATPAATSSAPASSMAPSGQPSSYDGTYVGSLGSAVALSGRAQCTRTLSEYRVVVANGAARFRWLRVIDGPVGPGGALTAQDTSGTYTLVGQFSGPDFAGTLKNPYCQFSMTLHKQA